MCRSRRPPMLGSTGRLWQGGGALGRSNGWPSGHVSGRTGMHVLVVEDDRSMAELLRRGLSEERHVVDVAHNGGEGLERAESGVYDALILDVMLPGIDGLEIARRLRAEDNGIPILM